MTLKDKGLFFLINSGDLQDNLLLSLKFPEIFCWILKKNVNFFLHLILLSLKIKILKAFALNFITVLKDLLNSHLNINKISHCKIIKILNL